MSLELVTGLLKKFRLEGKSLSLLIRKDDSLPYIC